MLIFTSQLHLMARSSTMITRGVDHPYWYVFLISFTFWATLLYCHYFHLSTTHVSSHILIPPLHHPTSCNGRYIFIHHLPTRFNSDILSSCCNNQSNNVSANTCLSSTNAGLGLSLGYPAWYNTDQFILDIIFHHRMKSYECLTDNSSLASAVFVPFYAGIDFACHQWGFNTSVRDSLAREVVKWLTSRKEWAVTGGKDHFMVAGRTTWDFRRTKDDQEALWGNKLLLLPETLNMTVLTVESAPWDSNDFAVPYPTYFHPSNYKQVISWQDKVMGLERPWLFAFAGAPRPDQKDSIRQLLIEQCVSSARCNLLDCVSEPGDCHSPTSVMRVFQSSSFCLQPRGDSATRRSTFDAMVAGCVPVFFSPGTAYEQYLWHLPSDHTRYSVFIPEDEVRSGKVSVQQVLSGYSEEHVRSMREEVVRMIPRLIYGDPRSRVEGFKDAFDVAVDGVLRRVARLRKDMQMMEST